MPHTAQVSRRAVLSPLHLPHQHATAKKRSRQYSWQVHYLYGLQNEKLQRTRSTSFLLLFLSIALPRRPSIAKNGCETGYSEIKSRSA